MRSAGMARVTLKTIAQETGLTVAAVSMALRGKPGVSEATRGKVEAVAKRLGYEPDPALHVLTDLRWGREGRRKAPNMAVYTEKKNWSPFFREVATGIEKAARELGYGLELICEERYPDPRRLARLLKARGVSAVLIGFHGNNPTWQPQLDLADFSAVAIGSAPRGWPTHQVRLNFFQIMELAWEEVRALGYRRIGYCHSAGKPPAEVDVRRLSFYQYIQDTVVPVGDRIPAINILTWDADAFQRWLEEWQPDAVISSIGSRSEEMTALLARTPLFSLNTDGGIPGIDRSPAQVGVSAVRFADTLYRQGERGLPPTPNILLISGRWVG